MWACLLFLSLKIEIWKKNLTFYNEKTGNIKKKSKEKHFLVGVSFGGFLYIAGGERYNNSMAPLNTVFRFDPRNGAWLKIANMKNNRQSFSLAVLNNMMYAVGKRIHHRHRHHHQAAFIKQRKQINSVISSLFVCIVKRNRFFNRWRCIFWILLNITYCMHYLNFRYSRSYRVS